VKDYPSTPDGRYFLVRGRLWRKSNPALSEETRSFWVKKLMAARRTLGQSKGERGAREAVNEAKIALGERGPVWWDDGAPDYNRHMARNTPYAQWYADLGTEA